MREVWHEKILYRVPENFYHSGGFVTCEGCGCKTRLRHKAPKEQHFQDCEGIDWKFVPPTVISFSGGAQSFHLVARACSGEFYRHPDPRLRLHEGYWAAAFADTGSEHAATYPVVEFVADLCRQHGVDFIRAKSPREALHEYLINLPESEATRVDQPPVFVDKGKGKRGRLGNRCTREWKIAPMRRAVSAWLRSKGHPKVVTKWIGLAADEESRIKEFVHDVQWERCTFPLLYLGVTKQGSRNWLAGRGYPLPVRSLCAHCPNQSPADFAALTGMDADRAVAVDEALRDMSDFGVEYPTYLSDTLIPVRDLLGKTAESAGQHEDSWRCASGRCGI